MQQVPIIVAVASQYIRTTYEYLLGTIPILSSALRFTQPRRNKITLTTDNNSKTSPTFGPRPHIENIT